MFLFNEDLDKLAYKSINDSLKDISINDYYNNEEFKFLIEALIKDKRKNVSSLGSRLLKRCENHIVEIKRVQGMYSFDKGFGDYKYVAGVDEVGRGPLAGPIVSCAVILDLNASTEDLLLEIKDSKQLSHEKRVELSEKIKEKALAYSIALCTNEQIDNIGIGVCNNKIFIDACDNLKIKPELILSDGYPIKGIKVKNQAVIKGDTKSASIACASIIAKVYRDNIMEEYHKKYPLYNFDENAGYGTPKHVEAIKTHGPCDIHRMSFLRNILNT